MSAKQRRAWIAELPRKVVDNLLVYHWVCLEEKVLRFGKHRHSV